MVQTLGAPELLTTVVVPSSEGDVTQRLIVLEDTLSLCPRLPETSRDQLYPLDVFFHYETQNYKTLLQGLRDDLQLLRLQAQGQVTLSEDLLEIRSALASDQIPAAWLSRTIPSTDSVTTWIRALPQKLGRLMGYLERELSDHSYDLSTFLHPGQFLQATLQDYARRQFKNAECLQYQAQVRMAVEVL